MPCCELNHVQLTGPGGGVLRKQVKQSTGSLSITAEKDEQHEYCFSNQMSAIAKLVSLWHLRLIIEYIFGEAILLLNLKLSCSFITSTAFLDLAVDMLCDFDGDDNLDADLTGSNVEASEAFAIYCEHTQLFNGSTQHRLTFNAKWDLLKMIVSPIQIFVSVRTEVFDKGVRKLLYWYIQDLSNLPCHFSELLKMRLSTLAKWEGIRGVDTCRSWWSQEEGFPPQCHVSTSSEQGHGVVKMATLTQEGRGCVGPRVDTSHFKVKCGIFELEQDSMEGDGNTLGSVELDDTQAQDDPIMMTTYVLLRRINGVRQGAWSSDEVEAVEYKTRTGTFAMSIKGSPTWTTILHHTTY
ncbi:hypothetical protein ARMGADRAFT_1146650 [Armillaria gallica]|uniref:Uncharacterized protein n=1 Tax=Armillaria gallica TaxID=47427 RepID=A0A2H3CPB0_ARMGA|nr:hypothetical protein ARMGADRAFT_1146650 [Armillaria gallica]